MFCHFFHYKIKIGIVIDNEQKFHSSRMILCTFKNPLDKKFFFCEIKILTAATAAADWPWDLKNLLKVGFIIEKQEVFFVGGYGETFLRKVAPKGLKPPPLPKNVISISCVESISFLTLYLFFTPF